METCQKPIKDQDLRYCPLMSEKERKPWLTNWIQCHVADFWESVNPMFLRRILSSLFQDKKLNSQKTPNSQSNLEKEELSWRNQAPRLQTILQSYSNQDSMVLTQKQKYRSIEQDRKHRDKPTYLWLTNL